MRILKEHPILSIVNGLVVDLPTPANISYGWGYGSILGLILVLQIATGVFLAMHYTAHVDLAFNSVEHIMRDVNYGWVLRYAHANGASMFFIMVYIHVGRGIYYGSYTKGREMLWSVGVIILVVMMGTAFLGYVLPYGMMSLWGATVITNLASAVPFVGDDIVQWLWGGYSVANPTLNRFFSLHYLMPFVLAGLAVVHIIALHTTGSNNPLGVDGNIDKIPFHPYFTIKDVFGFTLFAIGYVYLIYFEPNLLGHPDNYIVANPLVTPEMIQPEWYFLFAYAILRSIPNKLMGVIALLASLLVLLVMPFVETSIIRSKQFRPISKVIYWMFVGDFFILTFIGGKVVEEPYVTIGQVASVLYFMYFLVINPIVGKIENKIITG